jgi:uroporphyrinogen decarboxylase
VENEAPFHRATSLEEIENHPWPDPSDRSRYQGLKELARQYRQDGFGVVLNTPLMVMTQTQWMRGLEQFMMDKILEIQMEMTRLLLEEVRNCIDVVVMGDDLSHQGGLTYSPEMYRALLKPRHKAIIRFLPKNAGEAKILYHTCGAAEPLLRDLIEIGVEACNPVQVSAKGMGEI